MKNTFISVAGIIGGALTGLVGGWDTAAVTLLVFMGIDYLSGIVVAGVFKCSQKTENGALESRAGLKGLLRKAMILLILIVANRLDMTLNTGYIKDAVCIAFITNETISIIENAGLMGIPIPKAVTNAIELLKNKEKE